MCLWPKEKNYAPHYLCAAHREREIMPSLIEHQDALLSLVVLLVKRPIPTLDIAGTRRKGTSVEQHVMQRLHAINVSFIPQLKGCKEGKS